MSRFNVVAGAVLRAYRIHLGLSQGSLSRTAGITQAALCRYEAGLHAPGARALRAIAGALGLPLTRIAGTIGRVQRKVDDAVGPRGAVLPTEAISGLALYHALDVLAEADGLATEPARE